MDLDSVENLNEEQILNLYVDIIENDDSSGLIADAAVNCCRNRYRSLSTPYVSGNCATSRNGSAWCYGGTSYYSTTLGYMYCASCK